MPCIYRKIPQQVVVVVVVVVHARYVLEDVLEPNCVSQQQDTNFASFRVNGIKFISLHLNLRHHGSRLIVDTVERGQKTKCFCFHTKDEQGWRRGESTRLPPMRLGFDSRSRCHMWVEFVIQVLVLAPRGFSPGTPIFPSPQKSTSPNSNSIFSLPD